MNKLAFLLVAALLVGCGATGKSFSGPKLGSPEKATVYVYRPSALYLFALSPTILVDDEGVGSLSNGGFLKHQVSSGRHTVSRGGQFLELRSPPATAFHAEAGRIYYIRYSTVIGDVYVAGNVSGVTGSDGFSLVSEDQALREMSVLKDSGS